MDRAILLDEARLARFGAVVATLTGAHSMTVDEYVALIRIYIDQSLADHHEHAIVWHAALIDGLRQGAPWPQAAHWVTRRTSAWQSIARHMGLSGDHTGHALLAITSTVEIFMLGMAPGIERSLYGDAFLRLVVLRLFDVAPSAATGDWFAVWCAARTDARFEPSKPDSATQGPSYALGEAVARLLLVAGAEGITHRAIAAEARQSLAATTRHFATLQDLLRAGYDRIGVNMLRNVEGPEVAHSFTDPLAMAEAVATVWLSDNAMQGRALAGLLDVHIAAARDPALQPTASAIIAKLTILATQYFADENVLGVRTPFEAHVHYALSQTLILLAVHQHVETETLFVRSAARIAEMSAILFRRNDEQAQAR
ncbi:MAG: TetR/AcrR family transcriptional regulator [Sphingomonadaceae bacterium]